MFHFSSIENLKGTGICWKSLNWTNLRFSWSYDRCHSRSFHTSPGWSCSWKNSYCHWGCMQAEEYLTLESALGPTPVDPCSPQHGPPTCLKHTNSKRQSAMCCSIYSPISIQKWTMLYYLFTQFSPFVELWIPPTMSPLTIASAFCADLYRDTQLNVPSAAS